MSLLRRHDDSAERAASLAEAHKTREAVDAAGGRLTFLTESLRKQNETNHFVQRLQAAYGKGFADGQAAGGSA